MARVIAGTMPTGGWRRHGRTVLAHGARALRRRWRRVLLIAAGSVFFTVVF